MIFLQCSVFCNPRFCHIHVHVINISVRFIFQAESVGSLPSLLELWLDCNDLSHLPPVSMGTGLSKNSLSGGYSYSRHNDTFNRFKLDSLSVLHMSHVHCFKLHIFM